jgi:photosystem II stability/assembly factor-like uncharacterized protein
MNRMLALSSRLLVLAAAMFLLSLAGLGSSAAHSDQLRPLAGAGHWAPTGGPATGALDLLMDPIDAKVAFAATGENYVLKTLVAGVSWTPMHQGFPDTNVITLAMDPSDVLILYAGTSHDGQGGDGLFKSTDGGVSWSRTSTGLPDDADIDAIAIDPIDPLTVYAGSSGSDLMFKSTDGAASWMLSDTGLPDEYKIRAIAIDPATPSTIYAGLEQTYSSAGGAYKSTDAGATWIPTGSVELADLHILALVIDPGRTQTVYAGAVGYANRQGIYKTTDGGLSWTHVLDGPNVNALAMDPRHPRILFAGTDTGMARSTDQGNHWQGDTQGITGLPVQAVEVNPRRSQVALAATVGALYRTTDRGSTWVALTNVVGKASVQAFAADPIDGDTTYAAAGEWVFKTTDGGRTWAVSSNGLPGHNVIHALAPDPMDPQIVYAALQGSGVFKSIDGGATWAPANGGMSDTFTRSLAVDPVHPQTIYAGAETGIYKTTDGGQTWVHHEDGLEFAGYIEALVVDPSNSNVVYAGGYQGGCCSQPHMRPASPADSCPGMQPCSSGTATDDTDGVFKSTDGGLTWVRSSLGIGDFVATSVTALAIDPSSPQNLYAAVSCTYYEECGETYVYKTTDGAASWTSSLYVSSLEWFSSIAIDSGNPDTVYAGHASYGAYRTVDAALTWETINDGLTSGVNALVVTSSGVPYAGTYEGVFKFIP